MYPAQRPDSAELRPSLKNVDVVSLLFVYVVSVLSGPAVIEAQLTVHCRPVVQIEHLAA